MMLTVICQLMNNLILIDLKKSLTSSEFMDVSVEEYVRQMILGEAFNLQMGYLFVNGFSIDARFTHMIADKFLI